MIEQKMPSLVLLPPKKHDAPEGSIRELVQR